MNVLHVILTLERAGAQEVVRCLAEQHARGGCGVSVVTFVDGPVRHDLERAGIPVEVLGARRFGVERPLRFLAELRDIRRRLAQVARRRAVDVVQTHLLQTLDFVALSMRRVPPVRSVVLTLHNVEFLPAGGSPWTDLKRAAHRWLYRAGAGRFGAVVAVSQSVAEAARASLGAMRGRIVVIPNGVELERFEVPSDRTALSRELGCEPTDELILTVGRLTEQKGQVFLLRALAQLAVARPTARLVVVGRGELRDALAAEAQALGVSSRVHWLGERVDVPRLLRSVDVFALPSLWEGLSVALLEAMAAATPIVATDVAGTRQVLRHGHTGLVVAAGDAGALAQALRALLDDRPRALDLGRAARQAVAREGSAALQARRHLELYQRLVESS